MNTWRVMLGVAAVIVLAAGTAGAIVTIRGECDPAGPAFDLTVSVFNQFVEGDVTGYEIVLEESWVGACEPAAPVPAPAMPLPGFLQETVFSFSVPAPALAQKFLYVPRLKLPDGTLQSIPLRYGDVLAIGTAECFAGLAVRGYLRTSDNGLFRIQPCAADCGTWLCYDQIDLSALDPADYEPYLGTAFAVDVEGALHTAPMPGGPCLFASALRPTPFNDCTVVPDAPASWGGLKAVYR